MSEIERLAAELATAYALAAAWADLARARGLLLTAYRTGNTPRTATKAHIAIEKAQARLDTLLNGTPVQARA